MVQHGNKVHLTTDEVRGAQTPGVMRWVLGVSLLLAIALLSAIWITGALNHEGDRPNVENNVALQTQNDSSVAVDTFANDEGAEVKTPVDTHPVMQDGVEVIPNAAPKN